MSKAKINKFQDNPKKVALSEGIIAQNINEVPADKFLHEQYLPYAYYVIRSRALVNTDGLKPVHKRILYSMYKNKNLSNRPFVKTAKVAADVMGLYHPHGNVSIEDAIGRLAQSFSMRVPLIDPSGSVGENAGDTVAAARYWEARLTKAGEELVCEVDDNAVPMGRNYDDTLDEPATLPVKWPNALINGTEGIAVGYASKMFPHNPTEAMDAIIAYVKNPDITLDEIMEIMPAPDFPTGGEIVKADNLKEMYETGRGTFYVRGKYEVNSLPRGRSELFFYELPYQVGPGDVVKRIKALQKNNKLSEIQEVKDLSDLDNPLVLKITLKSGTNVDLLVEELYKSTPIETAFSSNQTVLHEGMPIRSSLFEIFQQFIDLRMIAITNTTQSRRDKASEQLRKNEGLLKVMVNIDKAISIIRNSETADMAEVKLMEEFTISSEQARHVLGFQLRQLARTEQDVIFKRNDDLTKKIEEYDYILTTKEGFESELISQLEEIKKVIADERRTTIGLSADALKEQEKRMKEEKRAIENSGLEVILNSDGTALKCAKTAVSAVSDSPRPYQCKLSIRPEDQLYAVLPNGTGVKVPLKHLPFNEVTSRKSLEVNYVGFGNQDPKKDDVGLLIVTNRGRVAMINGKFPLTQDEFPVVVLDDGELVQSATWVSEEDKDKFILIGSDEGLVTSFPLADLRVSNPGVKPIRGMNVGDEHSVIGVSLVEEEGVVITTTPNYLKVTNLSEIPPRNRDTKGLIIQRINKSSGPMNHMVGGKPEDLIIVDKFTGELELPDETDRARNGLKFPTGSLTIGYKIPETE